LPMTSRKFCSALLPLSQEAQNACPVFVGIKRLNRDYFQRLLAVPVWQRLMCPKYCIVIFNGKKMRVRYAIDQMVKSLTGAIDKEDVSLLQLPTVIRHDPLFEDEQDG